MKCCGCSGGCSDERSGVGAVIGEVLGAQWSWCSGEHSCGCSVLGVDLTNRNF